MGNAPSRPPSAGTASRYSEADPEYWRAQAHAAAQQRGEAFERSKACYARGDHAGAAHWSRQGKAHDAACKAANDRAAELHFARNNAGKVNHGFDEVDLHGLHVNEAVAVAERTLAECKAQGHKRVVFVVGKGLHSRDGLPRLKPAIQQLIDKHNLRCTPGVPNEGCLLVELVPAHERGWVERLLGSICVIC